MMEFFLSKVWVFLVSGVLLMVLIQGVTVRSSSEKDAALEEVEVQLKGMLESMCRAGPGLEQVVEACEVLPSSSILTVHQGYMVLEVDDRKQMFETPVNYVHTQMMDGSIIEVSSAQVIPGDSMRFLTNETGLSITVISQRTFPTDT